jgi:hypothetical protein
LVRVDRRLLRPTKVGSITNQQEESGLTEVRGTYMPSSGAVRAMAWVLVFGVAAGFVAFVALSLVAWMLGSVFKLIQGGDGGIFDEATTPLIAILAVSAALYLAGRLLDETAEEFGPESTRRVRRFAMPAGAAIALGVALLVWTGPLNWITVVALTLLPAWWIAGIGPVRLPHWAGRGRLTVALTVCVLVAFVGSFAASWHAYELIPQPSPGAQAWNPGSERIALRTPESVRPSLLVGSAIATGGPGRTFVSMIMKDRNALAGWHDLRAEAWLEGGAQSYFGDYYYWSVDPDRTEPLATGQVEWIQGAVTLDGVDLVTEFGWAGVADWPSRVTLSGEVRLHPTTRPVTVVVAITGVAPDGHRYLLGNPNVQRTRFDGTPLDWYQEILAGHRGAGN